MPPPERPLKWQTKLADRATAAVNLEARYQVPPHLLFELLADPTQHDKIFDAILAADAELLEEDGPRRKWRLDYTARWNFWRVSGVCENRLFMWTDSQAGTVTFKLREPGFLKRYEGTWTIKAGCGGSLAEFHSTASASSSPASSTFDLRSSSSAASGSSSSRGSSPGSSPRSTRSSWADSAPSADMFGANLSRGDSGTSSGSSISMRTLPLATVSAAGPASLTQTLSQGVVSAAATLGSTISGSVWKWLGYRAGSSPSPPDPAAINTSSSSSSPGPDSHQWPPLFKSAQQAQQAGSGSFGSSSSASSSGSFASAEPELRQLRPMPKSAIITAATLTSPKLTPPYPLNQALKVQSKGQVEEMLEGLVRAATAQLQAQPLQAL